MKREYYAVSIMEEALMIILCLFYEGEMELPADAVETKSDNRLLIDYDVCTRQYRFKVVPR